MDQTSSCPMPSHPPSQQDQSRCKSPRRASPVSQDWPLSGGRGTLLWRPLSRFPPTREHFWIVGKLILMRKKLGFICHCWLWNYHVFWQTQKNKITHPTNTMNPTTPLSCPSYNSITRVGRRTVAEHLQRVDAHD